MAISDSQKVDYLFKKIGAGVAKTDTTAFKEFFNEAIASPLLLRGENVWQLSGSIPSTLPSVSSSIVGVYKDSPGAWTATVQCTEDITASDNRTWKTNLIDWIPPEFGATYQVKVYIDTTGSLTPQTTGTQIYAAGSGNNDEWFFDYQSGVLHFIGTNIPTAITTGVTGKSIFVSGARYIGAKGLTQFPNGANIANIVISGNTITSTDGNLSLGNLKIENTTLSSLNGNLHLAGSLSNSKVIINSTSSLTLPIGSNAARPLNASAGDIRFNSESAVIEFFNGSEWIVVTNTISDQQIVPDGVSQSFALDKPATAAGLIVSINGTMQTPGTAYTVAGSVITFSEVPDISDLIDVRFIATAVLPTSDYDTIDTANVTVGIGTSILDRFDSTQYRSAKYTVQLSQNTDYQISDLQVIHNGSYANIGITSTGTGSNLATFTANITAGNLTVWITTTNSTVFKTQKTYFTL